MEDEFTAYDGLMSDLGDTRWAFGTGFVDPLAGIDTSVPEGVDPHALAEYCLALGDDALIYSHRLQQWVSRAPELEEETALANIALDLLGQARMLLTRAARARGDDTDEDRLAFFRVEHEFRNVRLVERRDDDFAELVTRLLIFATWRLSLFERLTTSRDPVLAAIAAKGAKELAYHRDYAAQWVVRLGDGTERSHTRAQQALERIWPLVDELFDPVEPAGFAADPGAVRAETDVILDTVLATATLRRPDRPPLGTLGGPAGGRAGRQGVHTEALGYVLAELQSVARQYPDARW